MQPASRERIDALWRAAQRLQRQGRYANGLPPLWFFTDPQRTPEPERIAERLPRGCGVVYRAFGAEDGIERGRRLADIARSRGLILLVGADPPLARRIGAAGVHLPERLAHRAPGIARRRPDWRLTCAAHGMSAVRAAAALPLEAIFVSPAFESRSHSAGAPLGAAAVSRCVHLGRMPTFALGGVDRSTIGRLSGSGVAGVAAVEAFLAD